MKLYGYFRSSATYRVRIALNLKGLTFDSAVVDLRAPASAQHTPEFRAVNAQGLIPVLKDGAYTLTQSLAIIEYLEETHPEPPLLPRPSVPRAQVRALALAIACDVHPLNNLRVLNYLRDPLGRDDAAINAWYAHWIAEGFGALEQDARRLSGDGRHLYGSSVTLADVCLVPQMYNAHRYKVDVTPYATLRAICAHLEALPAFARAAPQAQPDAAS
ncbi:MAG TPA: maleylacetoacetate isomerase [Dehalococcoidia bacterium]|nr:maleylacetoacetate isomerase [Steroidobacteraceae bacterium]HYM15462.1 maleylacetoacetate isomerase [Dehalococcoidia bacterium]